MLLLDLETGNEHVHTRGDNGQVANLSDAYLQIGEDTACSEERDGRATLVRTVLDSTWLDRHDVLRSLADVCVVLQERTDRGVRANQCRQTDGTGATATDEVRASGVQWAARRHLTAIL